MVAVEGHKDFEHVPNERVKETLVAKADQSLLYAEIVTDIGCVCEIVAVWHSRQGAIRKTTHSNKCIGYAQCKI
jgi:hypothetical protein